MPTLIPFPSLHAVPGHSETRRLPVAEPLRFPKVQHDTEAAESRLPEGESHGPEYGQLPRARAMHDEIVGLIRAVRGRFG